MFFSKGPKRVSIQPVLDVSDHFENYELIHTSLGPNQEICCLGIDSHPERIDGMFPPSITETKHQYNIVIASREGQKSIVLRDQKWNYHFVQPISGDHFLVVASRCRRYKDGTFDLNGKIFSHDQTLIREFLLGDGIQDVAVTKGDVIWTSYFDEGVFGNYGWDQPIGASGLLAWDQNGEITYRYNSEAGGISDCYALNVADQNDVWFYFYTEFDLVHLTDGNITSFRTGLSGSDGFIIYNQYVLFRGGYQDRDTYTLYEFGSNKKLRKIKEIIFMDGETQVKASTLHNRGQHLLLQNENKIYLIALQNILEQVL